MRRRLREAICRAIDEPVVEEIAIDSPLHREAMIKLAARGSCH